MNGMFGMAHRQDAIPANPVKGTSPIRTERKLAAALTRDEADALSDVLRTDERALELDLPDLVDFCLATGCRIGEALAVRESALDLDAGRVEINATIVRRKGGGLSVQERPKTKAGWRVLALPPHITERLRARAAETRFRAPEGVVFGSPFAPTLRDPSNTAKALRSVLDRLDFPGVTFHTFRKTVATRLDQAGFTSRQVADHLGHAQPSMTQDVYMGRKVALPDAAAALDR
jgi:integrase